MNLQLKIAYCLNKMAIYLYQNSLLYIDKSNDYAVVVNSHSSKTREEKWKSKSSLICLSSIIYYRWNNNNTTSYIFRVNRSLAWPATVLFYISLSSISRIICIGMSPSVLIASFFGSGLMKYNVGNPLTCNTNTLNRTVRDLTRRRQDR